MTDDLFAGERARDAAIEQVQQPEPAQVWMESARPILRRLCERMEELTTDDLWQIAGPAPEPRVMGALIRQAVRAKWIEKKGPYVKSRRPECHARPIPVWRSLLWRGTP